MRFTGCVLELQLSCLFFHTQAVFNKEFHRANGIGWGDLAGSYQAGLLARVASERPRRVARGQCVDGLASPPRWSPPTTCRPYCCNIAVA